MSNLDTLKDQRRGLMIVLSSPSGAGKTTMTRRLLAQDPQIAMSVSVTTRSPRPGERDGEDYYFITKDKFAALEAEDELLEHARVFDNYYGTPREPVEEALADGKDIVFDIDWQGAQQLTEAAADDLVKIFILPPNMRELEQRLRTRAQDSDDVIAKRMNKSENEISHWAEYDYVLVNENIDRAMGELLSIVTAERMRRKRQPWLSGFVKGLIEGQ
ncbi:guanylate kinase [Algimonas ampicilliniresistens]|uniref:Guanylate kinase n=1 Tax=Algimonas ampicilliniresistens TaxID=1298735 RepID=A0ABQ5VD08_9PROT|nr:guanylate kinase [Algimonas ampicilliniresistens]GLQ24909.1 guanylate kinase [Algimonas ampicilliniresistens]